MGFSLVHPNRAPADPLHVTMFYDRGHDEAYAIEWGQIDCSTHTIHATHIYIHARGVVALVDLPEELKSFYRLDSESTPHVSCLLGAGTEARQLGPLAKMLSLVTDGWFPTGIPHLEFCKEVDAYRITLQSNTTDKVVKEQSLISKHHGRELTDHEMAEGMLATIPNSLWSQGGSDIGHCTTTEGSHVYVTQYPFKNDKAVQGIENTLTDLWEAGVIELSTSNWNTPLRPVPKHDGTFRMAHDFRQVNDVTSTPLLPVPHPHRCMTILTPEHKWFSVIDLKDAFYSIPFHEDCRYQFAFSHNGFKLQYTRLLQGHKNSPGIFNAVLKQCLSDLQLPEGCLLIQYVDDILVAAPGEAANFRGLF